MWLTRVSIVRPIFMLMVITALVIMGGVSFARLNAELFPNVNFPVVAVTTVYSGASPDDVERLISKPIEEAVSGIANVDYVQATSQEGRSLIVVGFTDKANSDTAATDVERKVSAIRGQLPTDANPPSILKFDPGQQAVLNIALSGSRSLGDLHSWAKNPLKPQLEKLGGVGSVTISGGLEREIQVQVDPDRLRAYNMTIEQVSAALARENQGVPGGSLDRGKQQINVRLSSLFQSVDEIEGVVVGSTTAGALYLRNVAKVVDTYKKPTTISKLNGQNAVAIAITKQSSANEIETVDNVRTELKRLQDTLPEGVKLEIVADNSTFTRNSLAGVQRSLIEAIVLTGLVLLVFLHTLRSTTIVLFAIPTSLISTFLFLNFMGFTLNLMTTLALVLVIGVLVDDSIVVLENIFRHLELGETPWTAALNGRSEIGLAAIAITLVDVVVFLPVAFMSGTVGQFFKQFGLVIVSATLLSLFISFTLTPLLASRWLSSSAIEVGGGPWGAFVRRWERWFAGLERFYGRSLAWVLRHRWLPPLFAVLALAASVSLVPLGYVKGEFIPQNDNGLFAVTLELPPGSNLSATEDALRAVERRLNDIHEVKTYLSTAGSGSSSGGGGPAAVGGANARFGQIVVVLHDKSERKRSVFQVIDDLTATTQDIPGVQVRAQISGFGGAAQPVQVRATGERKEELTALAQRVEATLRGIPGATSVTNSGAVGLPETRLVADRARLADLNLTAQQLGSVIRATVDGVVATKLRAEEQDEVDIRVISNEATRADLANVTSLPLTVIRDGQPVQVRLDQVATTRTVSGPTSLDRRNRERVITLGANLATGSTLNDVTRPLQVKIDEMRRNGEIPRGYDVKLGGQAEDQAKAFTSMLLAIGLSVVLIYMLLAALYESMILPFATMFALPVAVVGALIGLAVSRNSINLLSMIGMIVLMGLVGKNGILLVDYTNILRQRGRSRTEALLEAGPTRLRPILMTTFALIFGMMPLALGLEEGSEMYKGIASVLIGGMTSSTILSLLLVPCMYTYFDDLQRLIGRVFHFVTRRGRPATEPSIPFAETLELPVPDGSNGHGNGHAAQPGFDEPREERPRRAAH